MSAPVAPKPVKKVPASQAMQALAAVAAWSELYLPMVQRVQAVAAGPRE